MGYAGNGSATDSFRISNTGTAAAHHVSLRLELQLTKGIRGAARGDEYACEDDEDGTTCTIGTVAAGSTATLAIHWMTFPYTSRYNERGEASLTVTADNAAPATVNAWAYAGTGRFPITGPDVRVRPLTPSALTVKTAKTVNLPIPLRADGNAPAEGLFVQIDFGKSAEAFILERPRNSRCVKHAPRGLFCYLPERLKAGQTSTTWGVGNPFHVIPKRGAARTKPHQLRMYVGSANATRRNIGLDEHSDMRIKPTLPLTISVNGNPPAAPEVEVAVRVAFGS